MRQAAGKGRTNPNLEMIEVEMESVSLGVVRGVELKPALNRVGCSCGRNNRTGPQWYGEQWWRKDDHTMGLVGKSQAFQLAYSLCHLSFVYDV